MKNGKSMKSVFTSQYSSKLLFIVYKFLQEFIIFITGCSNLINQHVLYKTFLM